MRYGFQPGTGSGVAWGLVALLLGLIGLAFPWLLVTVAVALTVRAVLWARGGRRTDIP
jgi:membrane protein implicated in regulation of membrane protease activity